MATTEVRAHFGTEGVQPGVYLHQWFLSLFINCIPLPMVLVFWDVWVCGGLELILPITVSLLQVLQGTLLSMQFEEILRFFKTMRWCEDPECDTAAIARCIVEGGGRVLVPAHVTERLEMQSFDEEGEWTPSERGASPAAEVDREDTDSFGFAFGSMASGWSLRSSLGRFGDIGLELQGVLGAPSTTTSSRESYGVHDGQALDGALVPGQAAPQTILGRAAEWFEDARDNFRRSAIVSKQELR